jgi:DNA polymerase-3 subunit chi
MTEIAFHFNVGDKLAYTCRLLRKAYASGAQVLVTGEPSQLGRLDQLLWTFSPVEFIPHERVLAGVGRENSTGFSSSPIVLAEAPGDCPHHGVLVNLGQQIPGEFERFERFIEIVAGAEDDRLAARQRWRHYAHRGYALQRHDRSAATGADSA